MTRSSFSPIACGVLSCLLLLSPGIAAKQAPRSGSGPAGPLHDRAVRAGGTLSETLDTDGDVFLYTLQEMGAHADAVVVGRVLTRTCGVNPAGALLTTDVALRVLRVVKGTTDPGSEVVVSVPGGEYRFGDGVRVFQAVPHYTLMRIGRLYALFLRRSGGGTFYLAAGPSSQFEMDSRTVAIVPASNRARDAMNTRYRDMDPALFLRELYASVRPNR